jgi:LPXTG-motif cell wall-anchored protein
LADDEDGFPSPDIQWQIALPIGLATRNKLPDRASANRPRSLRVLKYVSYPLLAERGQFQEIHMGTMSTQTWIILAGFAVLALIALAAWLLRQRKQSHRLEQRFGTEYGRTVDSLGSRSKAESELKTREKRVDHLDIVPLAPSEAVRFSQAWAALQGRFVDNPKGVVAQADQLVREVMLKRGYPIGDFERRAADISVDHPAVVNNYRAAQAIAVRDQRGEADTEELRKAVVHYRALFDDLLEVRETTRPVLPAKPIEVHS